jgi:hypothetical protein
MTEERRELLERLRRKHPKGNPESQERFCREVADERIAVYMECFSDGKGDVNFNKQE